MSLNNIRRTVAMNQIEVVLSGSFFDICQLEKLLRLFNLDLSPMDYKELRAFHCIHWSQMGPEGAVEFKLHLLNVIKRYLGVSSEIKDADYEVVTYKRINA